MINTYQTSLAPPPVPPRLNRSQPVLIPATLPSPGHSKPLLRFLVGVVLLHLLLSVCGFIYLYQNDKMVKRSTAEGKAALISSEKQHSYYKASAHMVVDLKSKSSTNSNGYLQWDIKHSVRRNINYYNSSWLTIIEPGDYYVYSKVTFSKGDSVAPLVTMVKQRKTEMEEAKLVMTAYCSLEGVSASDPHLCTATQAQLMTLEKGNQLAVWVQHLSLVDYDDGATTFGMYKV